MRTLTILYLLYYVVIMKDLSLFLLCTNAFSFTELVWQPEAFQERETDGS